MSLCNTNIKYVCTQNHPLQERLVWRIIFHAVRPFGRCVGGVDTCAGSRVLAHPGAAAFLFFKQSITQCAPLYKPFRQKSPKYRHRVAHGPGGGVRAPRPTDNMAAGESRPSGPPAPTERFVGADDSVRPRATARVAPTKRQGMRCKPGFGSSGRPAPTHRLPIEFRRGRRPRRGYGLPRARCALAMTGFLHESVV